ncbi:sensor histidine kinase [Aquimarina litoralis]|uniref:sensor histidine kinase n=1 Tax=Aquimarina litoralis TaxID=584605 RepID=UPI001C595C28|nr:ATP-binding protein [Aquimarina litoralis]MBW1297947.1 GHKL domain-containing protein [Aquimarina litoralis]
MNPLLKRQIRKNLPEYLKGNDELEDFLEAINKSYANYEEQFAMLQRAMSISSQELFDANEKLREEAEQQRLVIASLNDATKALRSITYKKEKSNSGQEEELTGLELASLIEKQAKQISDFEKQRAKILKDLEKSNEELSNYAQIVSHDLKSPLRNVSALVSWIKEDSEDLGGTVLSHIDHIEGNLLKMENLIGGILEYSLVDKKEQIDSLVNVNMLIKDTIESIHAPDTLEFTIDNVLPTVKKDVYRLKQLFQNLLSNAIKSITTDQGQIHIGSIEKDDYWEFYIKDNGKGIEEKYHKKIFEIFQSVDEHKKSTGIGLSIVKKIIDFYEGKIWLDSKVGVGTTFYFTLKKTK